MIPDDPDNLPDWDDDDVDEEGEEWKSKPGKEAVKSLMLKWRNLSDLVYAFMDMLADEGVDPNTESEPQSVRRMIYENITIMGAKIAGAANCKIYILQMENASVIRTNANQLWQQVQYAEMMGFVQQEYCQAIGKEIDAFRLGFRDWVSTFTRDDFEDEWGLYV